MVGCGKSAIRSADTSSSVFEALKGLLDNCMISILSLSTANLDISASFVEGLAREGQRIQVMSLRGRDGDLKKNCEHRPFSFSKMSL